MPDQEFSFDQLAAIGQLALAYAHLDFAVTHCAALLLQCRDFQVAWDTVVQLDFSRKCDKIQDLTKLHQKGCTGELPSVDEVVAIIGKCKSIANMRNRVIHAHIHWAPDGKHVLRHPRSGAAVDASPESLQSLAGQTSSLAQECFAAVDGLLYALEEADQT